MNHLIEMWFLWDEKERKPVNKLNSVSVEYHLKKEEEEMNH